MLPWINVGKNSRRSTGWVPGWKKQKDRIKKLTAQINKDFENSSLPSSLQGPRKKKIPNSRVRTGRKPGGQPGHKGHAAKSIW